MELRQLRYLVALADEEHFTRAAAKVHVAQPALSQQIRRLEQEIGLPLVVRTTRRVRLTEAGELLVARARRVLAEVDAARADLDDLAGVRTGHIVIGAMQSLGPLDLSALLSAFHSRYPGVDLTVREEVSDPLLRMVRDDAIDLAFLSLAETERHGDIASQPLVVESLVAILPIDHRLAGRSRLRFEELRGERFITFREGAGLRRILIEAAAEAGFEPQIAFESNNVLRGRSLASRGLGVAIVPTSDATSPGPPVAVMPVERPALARDVTLVWRRDRHHSPAAQAFLDLAQDENAAWLG
jgi:DNA-binding transcriptional LysR family regulator